jgi:signal transduction histidine kinase
MKQIKNRIIIFLFTGLAAVLTVPIHAQHFLDSLKENYNSAKDDTARVYGLYAISRYFAFVDLDSSRPYTEKALELAEKLKFPYGTFLIHHGEFFSYITRGNYPKAVEIAFRNKNRADSLDYRKNVAIATSYGDVSLAYRIMTNFKAGMIYARNAVELFQNDPNPPPEEFGSAISQIGQIKLKSAPGDSLRTGNNRDSVFYYLDLGYRTSLRAPNATTSILGAAFIGDAYSQENNYHAARKYYLPALQRAVYTNNLYLQARLLNNISALYKKIGLLDSCIYFAKASLQISRPGNFDNYSMDSYDTLSRVYEQLKMTDSALKYVKLAFAIKSSIFGQTNVQNFLLFDFADKERQRTVAAAEESYRTRLRIYGLLSAFGILLLLAGILYRNNLQRKRNNLLLSRQKLSLENALDKLQSTQSQLIQSEKMASLGEITAGIAHEIQNPLNFVNNFSEVNGELAQELSEALDAGNTEQAKELASDLRQNADKINQHGKRADSIVKSMLMHAGASSGEKSPADINPLVNECFQIAYHNARAKDKSFNLVKHESFDGGLGKINIQAKDMSRALLNLFNNAIYSMCQKKSLKDKLNQPYEATIWLTTRDRPDSIEIRVRDNGMGIPENISGKILQPFFTTKPTGEGTGLGLSLAHDIISKLHNGSLSFTSEEGQYAEFIIQLPGENAN